MRGAVHTVMALRKNQPSAGHATRRIQNTMGDKSPKANQKKSSQKDAKVSSAEQQKQQAAASKKAAQAKKK